MASMNCNSLTGKAGTLIILLAAIALLGVLASALPALSGDGFVSPANNSYVRQNITFNITLNTTSNATFYWTNTTGNFVAGTNNSNLSTLTFTYNTTSLADGNYNATANVTDNNGTTNATIVNSNITVDNTAPAVTYTDPTPADATYSDAASITVNVTVTETNFKNASFVLANSTTTNTTWVISLTGNNAWVNFSGLPNTNYTFNVTVYDKANQSTSTASRWHVLDTQTPSIVYTAPTPDDASYRNVSWIYINTTVTETNFKNATFRIGNSTWSNTTVVSSLTNTIAGVNFTTLADSNYTFNVTAYDQVNRSNTTSTRWTVVDTTRPAISVTYPSNGALISTTRINITGSVTDTNNVSSNVTVNNTNFGNNVGTYASWNFTNTSIVEGTYSLLFTANDSAGNTNTTTVTFTIDTTAPAVVTNLSADPVTLSPFGSTAVNDTTNITFNVTDGVSTGSGALNYSIRIQNSTTNATIKTFTGNATSGTRLLVTWNGTNDTSGNATDGIYTIRANITDGAGNIRQLTATNITVDSTAPTISSFTYDGGTLFEDDSLATSDFTCSVSDATSVTTTITGLDTTTSGTKTATCTTTDAGGNNATATTTYEVRHSFAGSSGGGTSTAPSTLSYAMTWTQITPEDVAITKVTDSSIGVKEIHIEVEKKVINVKVRVEKLSVKPIGIPTPAGEIEKYLSISADNLKNEDIKNAKIVFHVSGAWMAANNIDKESVVLLRRVNGSWQKLVTTLAYEAGDDIVFEADTPGFSYFAVSAQEKSKITVPEDEKEPSLPPVLPIAEPERREEKIPYVPQYPYFEGVWRTAILALAFVFLMLGLGRWLMRRRTKGRFEKRR